MTPSTDAQVDSGVTDTSQSPAIATDVNKEIAANEDSSATPESTESANTATTEATNKQEVVDNAQGQDVTTVPDKAITYDKSEAYEPEEVSTAIDSAKKQVEAAGGEVKVTEEDAVKLSYGENYDTKAKVADIQKATNDYLDKLAAYKNAQEAYAAEKTSYEKEVEKANEAYKAALTKYNNEMLKYKEDLASYQSAKAAYDEYQDEIAHGGGASVVESVQKLTFTTEPNALVGVQGIDNFLTRDAVARLGRDGMWPQYTSDNVDSTTDLTSEDPYNDNEDQWAYIKEGDSYTVTYTNLENTVYDDIPIRKVVYDYHLNSTTSEDGRAIVTIHRDPTKTTTMGASTLNPEKQLSMDVTMHFYDEAGNEIQVGDKQNAIISINSLNHWRGASYVTSEKPGVLTVQATATDGAIVTATYDPYANGTVPAADHGHAIGVSTLATGLDFKDADGNSKAVVIDESHPLRIVLDGQASDVTSVYASGAANGYTTSVNPLTWTNADNQVIKDVLGTYSVDADTGLITYLPTVQYDHSDHLERVGIGNNIFVKVPGSSITLQDGEAYSIEDNQYIAHGAKFDGESSGDKEKGTAITGWDSQASPYYYYGGAGVILKDAKLKFAVDGNPKGDTTVFWFAINSTVGLPKDPGMPPKMPEEPKKPELPEEPKDPSQTTPKPAELKLTYNKVIEPTLLRGTVIVHYVDEEYNEIEKSVVNTKDALVGERYNTAVDWKKDIIVSDGTRANDHLVYTFKEIKTGDHETGEVINGVIHVTYIYKKEDQEQPPVLEMGNVMVHYIDEQGKVIKAPVEDTPESLVGYPYDTTDNKPQTINFEGNTYVFIKVKDGDHEIGEVVQGTTHVTYIYRLQETEVPNTPPVIEFPELKTGNVIVHFVDESGKTIRDTEVDTPEEVVGVAYDTQDHKYSTIEFEGDNYVFIKVKDGDHETGKVVEGTTEVTYIYNRVNPTPEPHPAPSPEPAPTPEPHPAPSPEPAPTPEPHPAPSSEPTPTPEPHPAPEPEPTPTPEPHPAPEPEPAPTPESQLVPKPVPTSVVVKKVIKPTYQAAVPNQPKYHRAYTPATTLPQTGDSNTATYTLFGAIILAATLGLAPMTKRNKEE